MDERLCGLPIRVLAPAKSPADSRQPIEELNGYRSLLTCHWGIGRGRRLIGSVRIVHVNDFYQKAPMGYCLAREAWGRSLQRKPLERWRRIG